MNDSKRFAEEAKQYVKKNIQVLCKELKIRNETPLSDAMIGPATPYLDKLIVFCSFAGYSRISLAESMIESEAVDIVANTVIR